jgi:hypothetical protein
MLPRELSTYRIVETLHRDSSGGDRGFQASEHRVDIGRFFENVRAR